ncbi:flagellar type III secretion system protein FlhB [Ectobacillus sp. JY-23]|uniref:EscU/YscU/HrcU family type III secretion system export apparatus switch protein n=1 Tax=Ectobacillus sp. JY-23 TaxID=2933872 RepID=UPI001FF1407E|nr:EscU/YscU/HrcU family type III secretion system export apparatus switch protein [Ectobacillus sp. JY-23]UOY93365.1 flagellar type III secretion system protein FlhB [Ectobacillus sp. JY-23]
MAKDNKTEKATPQKRKKAREEGNIAKSKDISTLFTLLVLAVIIYFFSDAVAMEIGQSVNQLLDSIDANFSAGPFLLLMGSLLLKIMVPVIVLLYGFQFANYVMQVGFLFSTKVIKPKPSRINPKNYFTRLFSRKSLMDTLKSLLYVGLFGYVAYIVLKRNVGDMVGMIGMSWGFSAHHVFDEVKTVFLMLLILTLVLSVTDFIYQRWEHEQDLKMKKEEVKQEHKDAEGSPEVKHRQKSVMYAILQSAATKKMEDATFVINNPTHISVALRYDKAMDSAPTVVAKGEEELALYIRTLAKEKKLPMVENKPLARSLYFMVEEGEAIPEDLYVAVIEVMRYLIQTKQLEV